MRIIKTILIVFFLFACPSSSYAYYETHPPYLFKQGPYRHAPDKSLSGSEIPQFIKNLEDFPLPWMHDVYRIDVDGNGLEDYLAFLYSGAGTFLNQIHIYLKRPEGGYQKISYLEDAGASIKDIVDINKDGKWEIILTDIYGGEKHNYFSYSVYEIKDFRLVNADGKFKGFPKFVWITHKPNDKDTSHLKPEVRRKHVEKKNKMILNEEESDSQ